MTGEKDRYKTHEQLWKLEDGDLSTPQHDELVLQLLHLKNATELVDFTDLDLSLTPSFKEGNKLKNIKHVFNQELIDQLVSDALEDLINNNRCEFGVYSEVPIKSNNGFLIGYVDVQIKIPVYYKYIIQMEEINGNTAIFGEKYIDNGRITYDDESGFGVIEIKTGVFDKIVQSDFISYNEQIGHWNVNVEVKPKIRSFGETLRQINTYRSYTKNDTFVIYSPDTRFKSAFESQGIIFVTPSDLGINS